ncbi:hypothetical protein DTL21_08030 [Bremerella cremea]|uniref:Uncharacterized protein n=1 Tax=Blastopirellula marina TaxID=124 RepID=A0A2S8FUM7_9BACT|nr:MULTISPECIES: hypothetical protein [Pirellulaceae]PQO35875.1 hypothetical protein C5Y83_08025 [Blastopirellula marina]RCS48552.1 hypothetical protein DTL21_08030 [Bremerella cremea]
MTNAKQRSYYKSAGETVAVHVNCGPVMARGETVLDVLAAEIIQRDADGVVIVGPDKLTISGLEANTVAITAPGMEAIPIGRGFVGLVAGGNASLSQPMKLTIPFTTSGGQRRDAEVLLEIR